MKFNKVYLMYVLCAMCLSFMSSCSKLNEKSAKVEDYTSYVDTRIGTAHCRYFHFAPGALPFGMAKPGPSTNGHYGNKSGWEATGYDFRDKSIEGFPCTHEFQVGGITLMPTNGDLIVVPGDTAMTADNGYRSRFTRENEIAEPGYYSVVLDDYNIKTELTATEHVAYERFVFSESDNSHILFNIGSRMGESGPVKDAYVEYTDDNLVEGWVTTLPEYIKTYQPGADLSIYFSASLDKTPESVGVFKDDTIYSKDKSAKGKGAGLYITFKTKKDEAVTVKVGISYTSVENARKNRISEAENLSFDQVKYAAHETWNTYLSKIKVESKDSVDMVKFYTGLYHALLGRGTCSDVAGYYPKHDGTIGRVPTTDGIPAFKMYNTDAMWGAQWNLTQLWAMAYPQHLSDFIKSHLQIYKDCGWLADGVANCRYVSGVGTNLLSLMVAAAYQCGIRDFDMDLAYEACLKNELDGNNRPDGAGKVDVAEFVQYGYVPYKPGSSFEEDYDFSASHTLEYSYSAWAVAQFAKSLNKTADYNRLSTLADGWINIYDKDINFIRPRHKDGRFIDRFDPMRVWRGFQEGNSWQYTFYVPHEPEKLMGLMGEEAFNHRLDSIFVESEKLVFGGGKQIDAFAGLRSLYNHGNQPCLHMSWLFNHSGKPSLTQKWTQIIMDDFYGVEGVHGYGYGQDEDQGQLGAWYVMTSIGLFDVKGLTAVNPEFGLGVSLFDKVTITLDNKYYKGNEVQIKVNRKSKDDMNVKHYQWNGKELHSPFLLFSDFVNGGTLNIDMDKTPQDKY